MPAWLTLAELPWGTILKQAAALLKQANERRAATAGRPPVETRASSDADVLRQRLAALEQQQRADAELIEQLATQIGALAVAAEATAVKVRQAYLLAIAGVGFGALAALLAWFW